jgi:hypothetical protein
MKKLFLMLLVSLITAGSFAQVRVKDTLNPAELKPQEITGSEKEKIVEAVMREADYLKALAIIANDNEVVDPKNPSVYRIGKRLQIKWKMTSMANPNNVSFGFLVADMDGNKPVVYFDEKNEKYTAPKEQASSTAKIKWPPSWWPGGGGSGGGSGFCGNNWSGWVTIAENCNNAWGCFFKGQKAKFIQETRYCLSNPGNVQTRVRKVHCGC